MKKEQKQSVSGRTVPIGELALIVIWLAILSMVVVYMLVALIEPTQPQNNELEFVRLTWINTIKAIPRGSEVLCDDTVIIEKLECPSCSYWLKGRGRCAYKAPARGVQ